MTAEGLSEEIRQFWDEDAATYDNSQSHAPQRPQELAAWSAALRRLLPDPPAAILDVGAGTGFLSLLLAALGYQVTAADVSVRMLDVLQAKAGRLGLQVSAVLADAADPPGAGFDAVVERHLLWTLPDVGAALAAWRSAAPAGRLVLIEGTWGRSGGVDGLRAGARVLADWLRDTEPGHHGQYSDRVLRALPHGRGISAAEVVSAVQASPWGPARLHRLRDVEWAAVEGRGLVDELLGTYPHWAVTAGF